MGRSQTKAKETVFFTREDHGLKPKKLYALHMPGDVPHGHSCVTSFVLLQSLLCKDPGKKNYLIFCFLLITFLILKKKVLGSRKGWRYVNLG